MRNYTKEEKLNLLHALNLQIDNLKRAKEYFSPDEKNEILVKLSGLRDLRIKLILDISPIEIQTEDMGNQHIYDSLYSYCHLCGKASTISFPETPTIDKHHICTECFKKHWPALFQEVSERNARYFDDQVEAGEPSDKLWKDSLPF